MIILLDDGTLWVLRSEGLVEDEEDGDCYVVYTTSLLLPLPQMRADR